jgi:catechol 2,3-dioxygenase-like lactoylglutathione lyase family enzyme
MNLRLLVLRTANTEKLADFYRLFGMIFNYHQHDNSPFHYSALIGQCVFEIYPLSKSQIEADKHLRLGFEIDNFDQTIIKLKALQIPFSLEPTETEFVFLAIVVDPDGRKVELYKK